MKYFGKFCQWRIHHGLSDSDLKSPNMCLVSDQDSSRIWGRRRRKRKMNEEENLQEQETLLYIFVLFFLSFALFYAVLYLLPFLPFSFLSLFSVLFFFLFFFFFIFSFMTPFLYFHFSFIFLSFSLLFFFVLRFLIFSCQTQFGSPKRPLEARLKKRDKMSHTGLTQKIYLIFASRAGLATNHTLLSLVACSTHLRRFTVPCLDKRYCFISIDTIYTGFTSLYKLCDINSLSIKMLLKISNKLSNSFQ